MRLSFLKIESFRKGLVISTVFNFLSKLIAFIQTIVIAFYFGSQSSTDVYFYSFATVTLIATFINTLDSSVIVPESMRIFEVSGKNESMFFVNYFIYLYLFCTLLLAAVILINPISSFLLISKFNEILLIENNEILLLSLPLIVLIALCTLLSNVLTSYKFFTIPMVVSTVNGILSLLSIFFFHEKLNVLSILFGLITAYVLNLIFLLFLLKKNLKWNFSIQIIRLEKRIIKNIFYSLAGNITSALTAYLPLYLLSGFYTGIITTLNFGQKTAEMPNQLMTFQFSSVVGIKFNELYAKSDFQKLNEIFVTATKFLIFFLTPISCILFLFSSEVITLLYKRGAFDNKSVILSAEFLKYFSLLLPFLAINTIISRLFMAGQLIKYSFLYQIIFNFFLIGLIFFGIKIIGAMGYPIALLLLHLLNIIFCYFLLRKFFPMIRYLDVLKSIALNFSINFMILSFLLYLKPWLDTDTSLINMIVGTVIYSGILLIINYLFNINDNVNKYIFKIISIAYGYKR